MVRAVALEAVLEECGCVHSILPVRPGDAHRVELRFGAVLIGVTDDESALHRTEDDAHRPERAGSPTLEQAACWPRQDRELLLVTIMRMHVHAVRAYGYVTLIAPSLRYTVVAALPPILLRQM